jgi:hypothetical protein
MLVSKSENVSQFFKLHVVGVTYWNNFIFDKNAEYSLGISVAWRPSTQFVAEKHYLYEGIC